MALTFDPSCIQVIEFDITGCSAYGLKEFHEALRKKGISTKNINHWKASPPDKPILIIGTTSNRRIQWLLDNAVVDWQLADESIILKTCSLGNGGSALLITGTDENGLMYNLLEMARRIELNGIEALNNAVDLIESPQNKIRCVDRYLLGHLDHEWFLSEKFWHYLFQRMAKARFNRFCLIVGFDTPYMAPPYPYFLDIPGYPDVYVKNFDTKNREVNLATLRLIGKLCHEYGMKFIFATWCQRPAKNKNEQTVLGLPEEVISFAEYCYKGIKALIGAVPEIDTVQFRVNHESGVGTMISAEEFWNRCTDAVAEVAAESGRDLSLDLRAKGMTDSMIDHAYSQGLHVQVATKFWCEHAALPYHLSVLRTEEQTQMDNLNFSRRYSYADMLKKPRYYDVVFRLWNYGSTNLFLWGDADYARRFSLACGLSDSIGFQINTPLSLKYNHEPWHKEAWHPFVKPELQSGEWEDERYWMWYTTYGRMGYNPDTDPSIWLDEFTRRFGSAGPVMEKALALASKVIPLVTTIHMPVHPSNTYWTEMSTGYPLFLKNNIYKINEMEARVADVTYGSTEPSDQGLFYGADEFAVDLHEGKFKGKYTPYQTAAWLEDIAALAEKNIVEAEKLVNNKTNPEYLAFKVDITMLCHFARYHAEKLKAAVALQLWKLSGDNGRLSDTALLMDKAIGHWDELAKMGKENYYHDLIFGSRASMTRRGTWADLSPELIADKASLEELMKEKGINKGHELSACYCGAELPVERCQLGGSLPEYAISGQALPIEISASGFDLEEASPLLHYRHTDQTEGFFHTLDMKKQGSKWIARIPASYVTEEWDILVYVTVQGPSSACVMFPGVYHPEYPFPYHVITVV